MGEVLSDGAIRVLDHGFVRLDDAMASDLSVANAARVSFARRKEELDEADEGLIRFLMRERHGTPYEHNAFRFHIRCPIFVAREWFRHRIGCLTGDTVVTFVDTNGHATPQLQKTMEELWTMWSRGERDGHALPVERRETVRALAAAGVSQREIARRLGVGRRAVRSALAGADGYRSSRSRLRRMRLRVLDEENGEFGVGHVCEVFDKGVQPVYRLTLADGKELTVTENHRLLTTEGWATMRAATGLLGEGAEARMSRSCSLLTNGVPAHRNREWLAEQRRSGRSVAEIARAAGCSYHTIRKWLARYELGFTADDRRGRTPRNKGGRGYRTSLRMTEPHREAVRRAREQGPRVHARFDYTCQRCCGRGGRLHVHHVVPVWRDPSLARDVSNLVSGCASCHREIHRTRQTELAFAAAYDVAPVSELPEPPRGGWKLTAHPVPVVSVEYVGLRQTYDLAVEGPWHNFVADGVVVHNSFNEFSMRYAKATDEFYVPAPEDVRTQVGKPGAYTFEPVEPELAERTRDELQAVYEAAYSTYERLVEDGVAREVARCVLPVGAYTEFYWTVNARALMNFVSLRAAETAQREIRRYAEAVERLFAEKMPVTHAAFVANDRTAP
jgi:thymidylate synthase (FAD)